MALDVGAIADGLAGLIDAVPGVRCYPEPLDQVATSSGGVTAVVLVPGDPFVEDYDEAMSKGLATLRWRATVLIQRANLPAAHRRLFELLSSGAGQSMSLVDVLSTNSPGTWADHSYVESVTGVGLRQVGEVDYLGCDVDVITRKGRL
jgi:hypothetical protein